jgi:hypothetical protein
MLIERVTKLRRIESLAKNAFCIPSFDRFMKNRSGQPTIEERLDNAVEIYISGGSLVRITNEYIGYFEKKVKQRTKIRFLLLNPDSEAVKLTAGNVVYEISDYERYKYQIENSLECLKKLKIKYPDLVEIKISNQVPPFGLMIVNPNKSSGCMTVEIYGCALPARDRASFLLERNREPQSYDYFLNQFGLIWDNSSETH